MNPYLTNQQQNLLDYITREIDNTGLAPTLHQITYDFEIKTLDVIFNQLKILEQKGWIIFNPSQKRGISLINNVQSYRLTIGGHLEEGRVVLNKAI